MHPALVSDLCRPDAYPAPRPARVELATTHASWVFLTEREAWKVKRPVDLGFLDYSDPDERLRHCEAEVRLGARLAPGVYRGVAPVFRGPGGHSFVGPGPVVDHAVRMERLARADSAAALLEAGRLGPGALRRLADRLAGFYAAAPARPEHGAPAGLADSIDENHRQSLPFVGRFLDGATLAAVHDWQRRRLAELSPLLEERARAGRVREGHGDLRLEHVYFPERLAGEPLVIDPIEFNERFRCLDVALDVAFLAMELDAAGRPELGAYFVSAFARAAADHGLYPVLDLFLSYRAWVRAKVACLRAADPATPPGEARAKGEEARRLFALAHAYTRPRPGHGVLVAVGGLVGAGKSTVAEALGLALAAPVVSSDETRKALAGLPATARGGPALYTEAFGRRTYQELLARARAVLASGRDAVLDATFRGPEVRAAAREVARAAGRRFLLVEVTCDEATLRARLRAREAGPAVSDAREDLLPWIRARYRPPDELPPQERLVVDGRAPAEAAVRAVRQRLGHGRS